MNSENPDQTDSESKTSCSLSTSKILAIVLSGIGCVVLGFGQACSTGGGGGSGTSNLSSSSPSDTSTSTQAAQLTLTPRLQQADRSSTATVTAAGGVAPFTFKMLSGVGTLAQDPTNPRVAKLATPASDSTVNVSITDSTGKTVTSMIVTTQSAAHPGVDGEYSMEFKGTFTQLQSINSGCTTQQPVGDACNRAIHANCVAAGFGGGFGPVEHSNDNLIYACIVAGAFTEKSVNFNALTYYQSTCTSSNPLSDSCATASNRFCIETGYMGGFGPITYNAQAGLVDCLKPLTDVRLQINFTELTAVQPDCTDDKSFSGACFSAARRYCRAQGYVSTYGISEHGGGIAILDCIR